MECVVCGEDGDVQLKFSKEWSNLFWLECPHCECGYADPFVLRLNNILKNETGSYKQLLDRAQKANT